MAPGKAAHQPDRGYLVWQEGSHSQLRQNEGIVPQTVAYIHDNPVKRGYVDETAHWRYGVSRTAETIRHLEIEEGW